MFIVCPTFLTTFDKLRIKVIEGTQNHITFNVYLFQSNVTLKQNQFFVSTESSEEAQRHDDAMCQSLINQINRLTGAEVLSRFIRQHLLESNSSAVRWQAHGLLLHLFK